MEDAEQTLRELLKKILDERNYEPQEIKVQAIPSDGANYTSVLFLVSVSSPNRDDLKLFAKVASVGEMMRGRMNADWLYETERFVYIKLIKIYKDIEDELKVPDEHKFVFPKFYGYNDGKGKETLVMENLVESGYKSLNRFKPLDWEYACAGLENLAKFHALSFAFAQYYPEEFDRLTVNMKFKIGARDGEPDEASKELWRKMIERSLSVIEEDQRDAVIKVMNGVKNSWTKYNTPIGKPVIVHGDYRLSNLLFRKQGNTIQAISIDYQTVYAGTPVCDLIYFIMLGTDEEFRQQYFDKLLDHYYTKLEEALKRLSVDPLEAYPRDKFDCDIKKKLPYAVLLGVAVLPVVTVEAESAPRVDGDADAKDFFVKSNELYAQRFRGIVNDYIKWSAM